MSEIVDSFNKVIQQLTGPGAPFEMVPREINGVPYRLFKNAPASLRELLDQGRQYGERTFLVYEGDSWSFNRFFACADMIATQLAGVYGIEKGDRVAIAMRNMPEWMAAYVGIVSLGAVAVPVNSWGKREELEHVLNDSNARLVFCDLQRLDYLSESLENMNIHAVVARADSRAELPPRARRLEELLCDADVDHAVFRDIDPEDPVMIMYTSGTTGKPKGALSNNRNVVQAILGFELAAAAGAMIHPKIMEVMASSDEPTSILALPLFHVSGCHSQFILSLRGGRRVIIMYRWDASQALEMIEKYRASALSGAPKMVIDLLEHPDFEKSDTTSLASLAGGGAACPPKYGSLIADKLKHPYPGVGYGMTETNAVCASATGALFSHQPRSSGVVSPLFDLVTLDEHGNQLPEGETGEIALRSPTVVMGYWNSPEETAATIANGWLRTGDIGYVDKDNFLYLVDRAKDIIIRGGENISAAEVEGCLHNHPGVYDAAAFGVPDESLGEQLAVAVVLKPGAAADAEELREHVVEHLAGFKVPTYVWIRDEDFPRNSTGKPLKKQLKEEFLTSL